MLKVCPFCGKEFEVHHHLQKYCSSRCKFAFYRSKKKNPVITKKCIICGREFETTRPVQKCCSAECLRKRKVQNMERWRREHSPIYPVKYSIRICPNCGKEFEAYGKKVFCSSNCCWHYHNRRRNADGNENL